MLPIFNPQHKLLACVQRRMEFLFLSLSRTRGKLRTSMRLFAHTQRRIVVTPRMKFWLTCIATSLCVGLIDSGAIYAKPIPESQAHRIASKLFIARTDPRTRGAKPEQLRLEYQHLAPNGQVGLYVYTPTNAIGFAIVAGDDRLPQLLGYSFSNRFCPDSIPE